MGKHGPEKTPYLGTFHAVLRVPKRCFQSCFSVILLLESVIIFLGFTQYFLFNAIFSSSMILNFFLRNNLSSMSSFFPPMNNDLQSFIIDERLKLLLQKFTRKRWSLREKCPYSEYFWSVFSRFGLNTEKYSGSLRIHFKYGKMRTGKTINMGTFHAVGRLANFLKMDTTVEILRVISTIELIFLGVSLTVCSHGAL